MYQYICASCHRFSYSAAGPETTLNDKCPYPFCEGHVIPTELTYKRTKAYQEEEQNKKGMANCIIELKKARR